MKCALRIGSLWLVAITAAGCSSSVIRPDEYSGFLKDYSQLKQEKSPSGADVMRWVDPQLNLGKYTSVYIEPSQFYPKPQATDKIPPSTLQGITSYYDKALKRELGKSLPIAASPGPASIIVRPAITAITSQTQGLKPYEVIPVALVAAAVSTASGIRDQETTVATEAAFLDSDTNKVIAQVVRKGTGSPLQSASQVMKPADVQAVLDGWASDLHQSYLKLKAK